MMQQKRPIPSLLHGNIIEGKGKFHLLIVVLMIQTYKRGVVSPKPPPKLLRWSIFFWRIFSAGGASQMPASLSIIRKRKLGSTCSKINGIIRI